MITKAQAKKLRGAITVLVNATVADSWSGGGDPDDIKVLALEMQLAKLRLDAQINALTEPAPGALHAN